MAIRVLKRWMGTTVCGAIAVKGLVLAGCGSDDHASGNGVTAEGGSGTSSGAAASNAAMDVDSATPVVGADGSVGPTGAGDAANEVGAGLRDAALGSEASVPGPPALPCDVASSAHTPCVAAHSMVRAMFAAYSGHLFQVARASDSKTMDIGVTSPGGPADVPALNNFCSGTQCSVSNIYDQAGYGNHLPQADISHQPSLKQDALKNGTKIAMAVTGSSGHWLRNRSSTSHIPTGSQTQTEYMIVNSTYVNKACCYDYGNMEATVKDTGAGHMNALSIGNLATGGVSGAGSGPGPWAMVDLENGVFAGGDPKGNPANQSITAHFATILSKTDGTTNFAIAVGDAASGTLTTYWNGHLPNGYAPMRMEGGISLGEGGDGSNGGIGAFFEGAIFASYTTDATDDAMEQNIVSVFGQ